MRSIALVGALAVVAAAPLAAQGKFRTGDIDPRTRVPSTVIGQDQEDQVRVRKSDRIPPGQLPPAGMCRIWIDGVPPGRQPAPTDCQTAVATKPANARVIWGDHDAFPGKANGKFTKGGKSKVKGHRGDDDRDDVESRAGAGMPGAVIPSAGKQKSRPTSRRGRGAA
jgi:hypothetical protein